ncbi:hypothetical protein [Paenibacillus sp. Z6-24]
MIWLVYAAFSITVLWIVFMECYGLGRAERFSFHPLAVSFSHRKPEQRRSAVITVSAFALVLFGLILIGMIHFSLYCSLFEDRFNHLLYLYLYFPLGYPGSLNHPEQVIFL